MKKSITIYDIAKNANTSAATVSRVLSESNYPVSVGMREKIKRIAKEFNYVPNISGRQLKTNKSMTIGVIVPSISNPFYSSIVLGIEETARKNGYHVLLCNSLQNPELENEYIQTLFQKQVQGLIISSISGKIELLNHYISKGLNVVAIDQALDDLKDGFQIGFDYRKGGYLATEHLIQKGHSKIAYVTAPLDRPSRKDILTGYQDALLKYGITPDQEWIQITESVESILDGSTYEFSNGKHLANRILNVQDRPTAILACNDMTAVGIINELEKQGVKVPYHMSIIGIDNIELGQIITPSLSTIDHPKREMGKFACRMLFERMNGEISTMKEMVMQPQMIERGSVANIKLN
mgnify:CR=1 FL=1